MSYIETEIVSQNGQGKNTEEKSKADLAPIRLRERAALDRGLSDGAFRTFAVLIDLSLDPAKNRHNRGTIIISQQKLGWLSKCDERSVRRRIKELEAANYIWKHLIDGIGTKPLTNYHVAEFSPRREVSSHMPGAPLMGNGKRRYDHGFLSAEHYPLPTGNEAGRQSRKKNCLLDHLGRPVSSLLLRKSSETGQIRPVTADTIDRSHRTAESSDSGQPRPLIEDDKDRSQRSDLTGLSGQKRPLSEARIVRHIESQKLGEGVKRPSKALKIVGSKGQAPALEAETDFLRRLHLLAVEKDGVKSALAQSDRDGGKWRNWFREDPEKAERIYADTVQAVREKEVITDVARYLQHRWKEFASRKEAK